MASDLTQTPRRASCPACGAALRPDSPWCTLCYTDLRPPAETPPAEAPTTAPPSASYGAPAGDPLTQPLLDFLHPPVALPPEQPRPLMAGGPRPLVADDTWPCTVCGTANPLIAERCSACGSSFLAAATSRPSLVVPWVGDLARMSRGQRIWVAVGLVALVLVPLALVTLLLSKGPPPTNQRLPDLPPVTSQPSVVPSTP